MLHPRDDRREPRAVPRPESDDGAARVHRTRDPGDVRAAPRSAGTRAQPIVRVGAMAGRGLRRRARAEKHRGEPRVVVLPAIDYGDTRRTDRWRRAGVRMWHLDPDGTRPNDAGEPRQKLGSEALLFHSVSRANAPPASALLFLCPR